MERKKRTNENKTTTRKSRTQGRLGPYLSMRARRLQIYAWRQIFQNHSLRPSSSFAHFLSNHFGGGRKEDDSLPRKSHDNNASRKVPKKTTERKRESEREERFVRGHAERTKRSREPKYIPKFKSSIRNDGFCATTRRYGGG